MMPYINLWILIRRVAFLITGRMSSQQWVLEHTVCELPTYGSRRISFDSGIWRKCVESLTIRYLSLCHGIRDPTSLIGNRVYKLSSFWPKLASVAIALIFKVIIIEALFVLSNTPHLNALSIESLLRDSMQLYLFIRWYLGLIMP